MVLLTDENRLERPKVLMDATASLKPDLLGSSRHGDRSLEDVHGSVAISRGQVSEKFLQRAVGTALAS